MRCVTSSSWRSTSGNRSVVLRRLPLNFASATTATPMPTAHPTGPANASHAARIAVVKMPTPTAAVVAPAPTPSTPVAATGVARPSATTSGTSGVRMETRPPSAISAGPTAAARPTATIAAVCIPGDNRPKASSAPRTAGRTRSVRTAARRSRTGLSRSPISMSTPSVADLSFVHAPVSPASFLSAISWAVPPDCSSAVVISRSASAPCEIRALMAGPARCPKIFMIAPVLSACGSSCSMI